MVLDGDEPLWRIPAERLKMREAHIVPLARQSVDIHLSDKEIHALYLMTSGSRLTVLVHLFASCRFAPYVTPTGYR